MVASFVVGEGTGALRRRRAIVAVVPDGRITFILALAGIPTAVGAGCSRFPRGAEAEAAPARGRRATWCVLAAEPAAPAPQVSVCGTAAVFPRHAEPAATSWARHPPV